MKKIILFAITIFALSSCITDGPDGYPVTKNRLVNYAENNFVELFETATSSLMDLRSADAYEALPDEEKKLPIYSAFYDGATYKNGSTYYKNIGWITHDDKRFIEEGAQWGNYSYNFTCISENPLAWRYSISYYYETESDMVITAIDKGYELNVEMTEKAKNGYTSYIRSQEPVVYNQETGQFSGVLLINIHDASGKEVDWIKYEVANGIVTCVTSRG